jgi:hypothetical protein
MHRWRSQRGDVPVGCLVAFVIAVIVTLIAIRAVPAMIKVGEFDKEVKAQADRANRYDYTDKRIQKNLLGKARELDIPINQKSIQIHRTGARIKVRVVYDYEVRFPFYTYVWHKEHFEDRPLF